MFLLDMQCAGVGVPDDIPRIITLIIDVIKIAVPVLLIIFGMLDLGKAVMAQKEDEIKKGQQTFIKRLIAAAIVFFVVFVVQIMFNVIAPNDKDNIWSCVNCFVNYDKDKCK
ncbi:MAG: hypothetical protein RSB71_00305 [Bacilli bacterium]